MSSAYRYHPDNTAFGGGSPPEEFRRCGCSDGCPDLVCINCDQVAPPVSTNETPACFNCNCSSSDYHNSGGRTPPPESAPQRCCPNFERFCHALPVCISVPGPSRRLRIAERLAAQAAAQAAAQPPPQPSIPHHNTGEGGELERNLQDPLPTLVEPTTISYRTCEGGSLGR